MNRFEQDHKLLELHPLSTAQLSNCQLNLWALPSARAFATRRPTHILFRACLPDALAQPWQAGSNMPLNP